MSDSTIKAVVVEAEEVYLTKYAVLAANAGKHLHMEKPGGICFADFKDNLITGYFPACIVYSSPASIIFLSLK